MSYVVKMPKLGLEMEQGTVLEWHVEKGESIEEGDVLVEVESEKSIGEVEARENGMLRLVALDAGESVPPGTPIGIVAPADENIADLEAQFDTEANSDTDGDEGDAGDEGEGTEPERTAGTESTTDAAESEPTAGGSAAAANGEVKASPRAKRRAEELDVSLAGIDGTGPQGAITASDVDAAAASAGAGDSSETAETTASADTELHPQAEELLHDLSAAGVPPLYRLSVPEARETYRDLCVPEDDPESVYRIAEGTIGGPSGEIPIRVYDPGSRDSNARSAVVFFHGGGWMTGDLATHDGACRALANEVGEIVLSVDYRRAPEHPFPAALEDCYAVAAWATNAPDLGALDPAFAGIEIDPERVAVGGDSAGATLAAGVSLLARDRGARMPAHQLLAYPATDHAFETESYTENASGYFLTRNDMERFWGTYLETDLDGTHPYASPLRATDLSGLPSTTVLTCGFDPLRDDGAAYASRLSEAGIEVNHVEYPDMIHGFLTMLADPEWERAREAIGDLANDVERAFAE